MRNLPRVRGAGTKKLGLFVSPGGGAEVTVQGGTNPDVNGTVIGPSFQETFVLSAGLVPVTPPPPPPPLCNQDDQGNQNQGGNDQGCSNP